MPFMLQFLLNRAYCLSFKHDLGQKKMHKMTEGSVLDINNYTLPMLVAYALSS